MNVKEDAEGIGWWHRGFQMEQKHPAAVSDMAVLMLQTWQRRMRHIISVMARSKNSDTRHDDTTWESMRFQTLEEILITLLNPFRLCNQSASKSTCSYVLNVLGRRHEDKRVIDEWRHRPYGHHVWHDHRQRDSNINLIPHWATWGTASNTSVPDFCQRQIEPKNGRNRKDQKEIDHSLQNKQPKTI